MPIRRNLTHLFGLSEKKAVAFKGIETELPLDRKGQYTSLLSWLFFHDDVNDFDDIPPKKS